MCEALMKSQDSGSLRPSGRCSLGELVAGATRINVRLCSQCSAIFLQPNSSRSIYETGVPRAIRPEGAAIENEVVKMMIPLHRSGRMLLCFTVSYV
jgi:hypothetical protein